MTKPIRLIWVDDGRQYVQNCSLVEEDDEVIVPGLGGVYDAELHWTKEDVYKRGLVLFSDENGVFCLHPDKILKIDIL